LKFELSGVDIVWCVSKWFYILN